MRVARGSRPISGRARSSRPAAYFSVRLGQSSLRWPDLGRAARALTALPVALALGAAALAAAPQRLAFPRLNQTYRDMRPEIAPVAAGGLTVRLRSPANSLTVREHRIDLETQPDGSVGFVAWVSVLGKAQVGAELAAGGSPAELQDEVLVLPQEVEVAGRADVRRTAEGYEVVPRELPSHVELRIQSRLAAQLVGWCDLTSILVPGMECAGLEVALSKVRLPLPAPGDPYFVEASQLRPEEVAQLDAALGTAPPPAAAPAGP